MKRTWRGLACATALSLAGVGGCQTYVMEASLTLPTGHYLRHFPQYIPPTPPYPLPIELSNLQAAAAAAEAVPPPPGQ